MIPAVVIDLPVQKGAKFYQEFQQVDDDGQPISLANCTIKCYIKESLKTETMLHELTVANGGVSIVSEADGSFGIYLSAQQTRDDVDTAVYQVILIENLYPDVEDVRIIEGKLIY